MKASPSTLYDPYERRNGEIDSYWYLSTRSTNTLKFFLYLMVSLNLFPKNFLKTVIGRVPEVLHSDHKFVVQNYLKRQKMANTTLFWSQYNEQTERFPLVDMLATYDKENGTIGIHSCRRSPIRLLKCEQFHYVVSL